MKIGAKRLLVVATLVLLFIAIFAIGKNGVSKSVEKVVPVTVHTNATETTPSTITINGSLKRTFFPTETTFEGTFAIPYVERTCRDDARALIYWSKTAQSYAIMDNETFSLIPVDSIKINWNMDEIQIAFADGAVIETASSK